MRITEDRKPYDIELNDPAFVAKFIEAKIRMMHDWANMALDVLVEPGEITVTYIGNNDHQRRQCKYKMLTHYNSFEDREDIVKRAVPKIMFTLA